MMKKSRGAFWVISILIILISTQIFIYGSLFQTIKGATRTINEIGRIRGSIQRLVKLEIVNNKELKLRKYIDDSINFYAAKEDADLNNSAGLYDIENLKESWRSFTVKLDQYHENSNLHNRNIVLRQSEELWKISDIYVTGNQYMADKTVAYFKYFTISLGLNTIAIIFILIFFKKRVYDELEISAIYDPLTKVFNRRYFNEYITKEILTAKRKETLFCLIMMDIDYFKKINDRYGHAKGDYVLQALAAIVKESIRSNDVFSRIGGEEFTIIVPDMQIKNATILAERIRKSIEMYAFEGIAKVTISIGVTEFQADDNVDTILKRADAALYKAKTNGRNRVEIDNNLTK